MIELFKVTDVGLGELGNQTFNNITESNITTFGNTTAGYFGDENFTSFSGHNNATNNYNGTLSNTTSYTYDYFNGTREPSLSKQNLINWGSICRNPIVDSFITEPCYTLTTPDGYTVTPEGESFEMSCRRSFSRCITARIVDTNKRARAGR